MSKLQVANGLAIVKLQGELSKEQFADAFEVFRIQRFGSLLIINEPTCDELSRCDLHQIPVNKCIECWPRYLALRLSVIVQNYCAARGRIA